MDRVNNSSWCCNEIENYLEELKLELAEYKESNGDNSFNGEIKIFAPYGLNDIFTRTIRPIKHIGNSETIYNKKVESWQKRFSNLNIIEW